MEESQGFLLAAVRSFSVSFPSFLTLVIVVTIVFLPVNRIPFFRFLICSTGTPEVSSQPEPSRTRNSNRRRNHPRTREGQRAQKKRAKRMAEILDRAVEDDLTPTLEPTHAKVMKALKVMVEEHFPSLFGDKSSSVDDKSDKVEPDDTEPASVEPGHIGPDAVEADSGLVDSLEASPTDRSIQSDNVDHEFEKLDTVSTTWPTSDGPVDTAENTSSDSASGSSNPGEQFKPCGPASIKLCPDEQITVEVKSEPEDHETPASAGTSETKSAGPVEHEDSDSTPENSSPTITCESLSVKPESFDTAQSTPGSCMSAMPSSTNNNVQSKSNGHHSEKYEPIDTPESITSNSQPVDIDSKVGSQEEIPDRIGGSKTATPGISMSQNKGKNPVVEHDSVKHEARSMERSSVKTGAAKSVQPHPSTPRSAKSSPTRSWFQSTPNETWKASPFIPFKAPVIARTNRSNQKPDPRPKPCGSGGRYNRVGTGTIHPKENGTTHRPVTTKSQLATTSKLNLGEVMNRQINSPKTGGRFMSSGSMSPKPEVSDSENSGTAAAQLKFGTSGDLKDDSLSLTPNPAKPKEKSQKEYLLLSFLDTDLEDLPFDTLKPLEYSSIKLHFIEEPDPEQYAASRTRKIDWGLKKSSVFDNQSEEAEAVTWHGNVLPGPPLSNRLFFQYGLRYIPSDGETNVYRTVKIEDLPHNTMLNEVLKAVPGTIYSAGMFDTTTINGSKTVIVVFVEQKHAFYLIDLAEKGLKTGSALARVTLVNTPTYPFSAEVEKWVEKGQIRTLVLSNLHDSTKKDVIALLNGSELVSCVESIKDGPQNDQLTVNFYTIQSAIKACHTLRAARNGRGQRFYVLGHLKEMDSEQFCGLGRLLNSYIRP